MTFQFPSEHHHKGWSSPPPISQQSARQILDHLHENNIAHSKAAQVHPGIYLGDLHHAKDRNFIRDAKITHVLTILAECPDLGLPDYVNHKIIPSRDDVNDALIDHFKECWRFIANAMSDLPPVGAPSDFTCGRILIHCREGISRSPTVLAAYLMREERLHSVEALQFIKRFRPIIDPNEGFREELHVWGQCRGELQGKVEYNDWKQKHGK